MRIKRVAIIILVLIIISSCAMENRRKRIFFAMGNIPVEIVLYSKESLDFDKTLDEIEIEIKKLDSIFSKYSINSSVYAINESGYSSDAPKELLDLIALSDSLKKNTAGLFDIEIETLLSYYKRCEKEQRKPSSDSINHFVSIIIRDSLYVRKDSVYKSNPNLKIDFGGIAKGYFGDIVLKIMKKNNFKKGTANIGGQIVAMNELDNKYFKIGIRSAKSDSVVKIDSILNGSISTSGDYFRYYEIAGESYCHIVNPLTGLPSREISSVTVKAPTGAEGDAYSTALMLMNDNERDGFLKEKKEISIYIQK